MLYVVATFQSRCLAAFFPQGLIAVRYKALVRFESVCSSRGTSHYFDEVIRPHWPWLVDNIGSYFHMHAFSGLSVNNTSWLCLFLYSPFCCDVRAGQKVFTSIRTTLLHLQFLLAVAHLGRLCFFSPRTLLVLGGLWVYSTWPLELGSNTSLHFKG